MLTDLLFSKIVQTFFEAHTVSYSMDLGFFPRSKGAGVWCAHFHLVRMLRMSGTMLLFALYALMAWQAWKYQDPPSRISAERCRLFKNVWYVPVPIWSRDYSHLYILVTMDNILNSLIHIFCKSHLGVGFQPFSF